MSIDVLTVVKTASIPFLEWRGETLNSYFVVRYNEESGLWLGMADSETAARVSLMQVKEAVPGWTPSFRAIADFFQWKLTDDFQEFDC